MSALDNLLREVRYLKGEVLNTPQTWSDTHVSGRGSGGHSGYSSGVSISSKVETWTTFLIETENGKEFMVKWPDSIPVRRGHFIKVAVFREKAIALINEKTDTSRYIQKLEAVTEKDVKLLPSVISFGVFLVILYFAYQLFQFFQISNVDDPSMGTGTSLFATIIATIIIVSPLGFLKMNKTSRLQKRLPKIVLAKLYEK